MNEFVSHFLSDEEHPDWIPILIFPPDIYLPSLLPCKLLFDRENFIYILHQLLKFSLTKYIINLESGLLVAKKRSTAEFGMMVCTTI